jgi:hypothetical protein
MFSILLTLAVLSGIVLGVGLAAMQHATHMRIGAQPIDTEAGTFAAWFGRNRLGALALDRPELVLGSAQADLSRALRSHDWAAAGPTLLVMHGMMGLLMFGALALLAATDERLVGAAAIAMVGYAVIRMGWSFSRKA